MSTARIPQIYEWYLVDDHVTGWGKGNREGHHPFIVRREYWGQVIVYGRTREVSAYSGLVTQPHEEACASESCKIDSEGVINKEALSWPLPNHTLAQFSCVEPRDEVKEWLADQPSKPSRGR